MLSWIACLPFVLSSCLECALQDQLFDWVRGLGGFVSPKIELSAGHDASWTVRGLFATADIAYDELLFSIPHQALICTGRMEKGDCHLVTQLRDEINKGKESSFAPYLAVLEFQNPLIWTSQEEDLLKDFTLNFKDFNQTYADWCGLDLSHERTLEAAALTWSRQFFVGSHCMVPVLDLFNHHGAMKNVNWYDDVDMLHIKSISSVPKGSQLFVKYEGPTPDLFRTLGFLEAPPRQWFFDGSNNKRQFFSIDASENVLLKARGEASLAQFARLIREHLTWLEHRSMAFDLAAAAYKGSPHILSTVQAYREAYVHALRLALETSEKREL